MFAPLRISPSARTAMLMRTLSSMSMSESRPSRSIKSRGPVVLVIRVLEWGVRGMSICCERALQVDVKA